MVKAGVAIVAISLLINWYFDANFDTPYEKLCQLYDGNYADDFAVEKCHYTVCQRSIFDGESFQDVNVWYKHGSAC